MDTERNKDFVYLDRFVWDTRKNELNKTNHGVSFETAARIFNDPVLYTEYDRENSERSGEHRERNMGMVDGVVVLLVATTDTADGMTRIFSARKAEKKEVRIYERNAKTLLDH
jgi:hypothetical protein